MFRVIVACIVRVKLRVSVVLRLNMRGLVATRLILIGSGNIASEHPRNRMDNRNMAINSNVERELYSNHIITSIIASPASNRVNIQLKSA